MEERLLLGSVCPAEMAAGQLAGACLRLCAPVGTECCGGAPKGLLLLLGEAPRAAQLCHWVATRIPRPVPRSALHPCTFSS